MSKCRLECEAASLNESCGCKDAHMPGRPIQALSLDIDDDFD